MTPRRTHLLIALVIVAAAAATVARAHLSKSRIGAVAARRDLTSCARQIADLHRWRTGAEARSIEPDTSQLTRLLREAASEAGALDSLVSIEPGPSASQAGEYAQLPVFLRLEALPMKELTMFLHRLASIDPSSRAQSIELSPAGTRQQVELWNADVTIAYISYQPGEGRP